MVSQSSGLGEYNTCIHHDPRAMEASREAHLFSSAEQTSRHTRGGRRRTMTQTRRRRHTNPGPLHQQCEKGKIKLQGLRTDFYLLNVHCCSKKVCFIHTSPRHGQFRQPVTLHHCSSETALFFSIDPQTPRWAHGTTQITLFSRRVRRRDSTPFCQSKRTFKKKIHTHTKSRDKRTTSTPLPCSGRHSNHHVHCAKTTKITCLLLNAIVPFCYDHSHALC